MVKIPISIACEPTTAFIPFSLNRSPIRLNLQIVMSTNVAKEQIEMAYLQCGTKEVPSCWSSISAKQHLRSVVAPQWNSLVLDKLKDQLRREEMVLAFAFAYEAKNNRH